MAINQQALFQLQRQTELEGRRITLQEAQSVGIPPDEYHKLYGGPNVPLDALQAQYGGNPPAQVLAEAGYAPGQIAQLKGLPPGSSISQLMQIESQRSAYQQGTAREGSRGTGPDIGAAREVNPVDIGLTPEMEAAQMGDVSLADNIDLGQIERMTPAQIEAVRQAQAARLDANTIDNESEYRDQQLRLAQTLERTIAGEEPTLSELQLRAATDRNNAQAQGLIASQRGVNSGLATRLAMEQTGEANQQAAQQAAQLRLAEAIQARQELAGLSAQGRAQDFQVDATNTEALNRMALEQGQLDTTVNIGNAQAANQIALQQAQLQQQAGQFNTASNNQRQVEQGDINARLALANQLANNTQNFQQSQLTQGANQVNATLGQQQQFQQGQLTQQANLANQQAVNQQEIARGQTAAGIRQSQISGGSSVAAAQAGAYGSIQSSQIAANASILNNAMSNATALGGQQAQAGSNFGTVQQGTANQTAQNQQQIIGAGLGALGAAGAGALSDKNAKKDVSSADSEIKKWLDELSAKNYKYKQEKHGKGKKTGVMAQDLEKSPIGKSMVENTEDGKMVDFGKGLGAMLASLASINKRLNQLEA